MKHFVIFFFISIFYLNRSISAQIPDFGFIDARYDSARIEQANAKINTYNMTLDVKQKQVLLKQFMDSDIDVYDYITLANHLGQVVTPQDKKKLAKKLDIKIFKTKSQDEKDNLEYKKKQILEGEGGYFEKADETYQVQILDFNKDKQADMLLFPRVYFGPSDGYYMYGFKKGSFEYLFDNSGDFEEISIKKNQIVLRYSISIIDQGEPQILQTIVFQIDTKYFKTEPKLYYASQTVLPTKWNTPKPFSLKNQTNLRTHAVVDDTPRSDEMVIDTVTKTLRGNVICEIASKSEGFILAEKGEWAFVAFKPNSKIVATSLRHGLDFGYHDEKGNYVEELKANPYWCGWIEKKSIEK